MFVDNLKQTFQVLQELKYSLIDENKRISNFDSNIMLDPFLLNCHFVHHVSWEETLAIIHLGQKRVLTSLCGIDAHTSSMFLNLDILGQVEYGRVVLCRFKKKQMHDFFHLFQT